MRCPECRHHMTLNRGEPMERGGEHWAAWECTNDDCWQQDHPIPAPEYDWEYFGFTDTEIAAMPVEWREPIKAERSAYRKVMRGKRHDRPAGGL